MTITCAYLTFYAKLVPFMGKASKYLQDYLMFYDVHMTWCLTGEPLPKTQINHSSSY